MKYLLVATALVLGAMPAFAADEQGYPDAEVEKVTRVTSSGTKVFVYSYQSVDVNCKAMATPTLAITKEPENGSVVETEEDAYPTFVAPNPRIKCNKTPLTALKIFYTPEKGFSGTDYFSYIVTYENGNIEDVAVKVIVR